MQRPSPQGAETAFATQGGASREIVQAALALFAERGFAATKLEDVAARAGIGKGTIYLYFPTKEDLFRAVVREGLLPNLEPPRRWSPRTAGPPRTCCGRSGVRSCACSKAI